MLLIPFFIGGIMKKEKQNNKGFSLLELLVVILIIGILAAVALPQYNYSVMKTRYMRMADMARVIKDAQERYYMAQERYAKHFSDLDIDFPVEITDKVVDESEYAGEAGIVDDILIQLYTTQTMIFWMKNNEYYMLYALRLYNISMWGEARGMCAAYPASGEQGKKICRSFPGARNCKDVPAYGRYSCRIY